jgi:hypothetical protein
MNRSKPLSKNKSSEESGRHYLKRYGLFLGLFILITACFNMTIDPRGYFYFFSIPKINETRYFAKGNRIEKSIRLVREDFDAIIAGSSRTKISMDPAHPALNHFKAYNLALAKTNVYELEKILDFALKAQEIKLLMWGLDFLTFSTRRTVSGTFDQSLFKNKHNVRWLFDYLLSLEILGESIQNIIFNILNKPAIDIAQRNGFTDKTGGIVNSRDLFTRVLTERFFIRKQTYGGFIYGKDRVEKFKNVLGLYARKKVKIILFITPIHARQQEALDVLGLYETFENWKRDLVYAVEEVRSRMDADIILWDFSGYNSITTEDIPDNDADQMQWYWESSHYKKELGDLMLTRMLPFESDRKVPDDFGFAIHSGNIEAHLAEIRRGKDRYFEKYPEEVEDVRLLAEKTAHQREKFYSTP